MLIPLVLVPPVGMTMSPWKVSLKYTKKEVCLTPGFPVQISFPSSLSQGLSGWLIGSCMINPSIYRVYNQVLSLVQWTAPSLQERAWVASAVPVTATTLPSVERWRTPPRSVLPQSLLRRLRLLMGLKAPQSSANQMICLESQKNYNHQFHLSLNYNASPKILPVERCWEAE